MASLSNINGLFDVHSTGAILFSTSHGTSGQILRSNGNAAPTWVDASTVISGPYLPLTGGTLSGPLSGTSATFSGNITIGSTSKTTNTVVQALSNDNVNAGFEARGASQGTGYFYAGQSASHGGGMFYNGNGAPAFAAGETNDAISFYRRAANVQTVVFDFMYNSNTVRFKGAITIAGDLTGAGAISGASISVTGSVVASGNSNSFGNTTIAALSASTGTFSSSVTAAGNSNSFGNTSTGALSATTVGVTNIVTNVIPKFNGTIFDDSLLKDDGTLTYNGDLINTVKEYNNYAGKQIGSDTLLEILESDNTATLQGKLNYYNSAVTRVEDSTAPAGGCFELNNKYAGITIPGWFKVESGQEYTFEVWAKFISGTDTDQRIYAGSSFYDANKGYLGNTQRYWGESGFRIDASYNNDGWYFISGTLGPNAGTGTGNIPTAAKWMRLIMLLNYSSQANVIRLCGLRYYKSGGVGAKLHTSIYRKAIGSEAGTSAGAWLGRQVMDTSGNLYGANGTFTGDVGIGTTSPTQRLQLGINGSLIDSIRMGTYAVAKNTRQYIGYTRADSGLFETVGNGDTPSTVLAGVAGIRIVNSQGILASSAADNSVQLLTHIYNGGSRVALHARYDGNVGIGTTTPRNKLTVKTAGSAQVETGLRLVNPYGFGSAGTGSKLVFAQDRSDSENYEMASIQSSQKTGGTSVNSDLVFSTRNSTLQERFRITFSGNLIAPAVYNLTTSTAANMYVSSTGFFYRSTSSLKYKTDVRNYDKGLNEVMQLQPKYYKGKNDGDTQFAGLIAEDVHDLGLNEFVQYAEDGTPDALAYANMIALLTKAIQELKAEIEILKNK